MTKEQLKNSTLQLKFVNREDESELIVNTFIRNKKQQNLSQAKLVSLFQTFGIGKTTLVRRFREVYDHKINGNWDDESKWVKDLQLFELDFRLFRVSSNECIMDMSKKIADFVIKEYQKQFITKFQFITNSNGPLDLLQKRQNFHQTLLNITRNKTNYGADDVFEALNIDPALPEGYLVLVDEVDGILQTDFGPLLQDSKWNTCKEGCDIYLSRFLELWNQVMPILVPSKSAVIFSGHIPVHLALAENQNVKGGSPSDYCLVFLSPMEKQVLKIMISQSMVQKGNSCITLLNALELLGLRDIDEFVDILIEYTGTVPRIMENAFISILNNLNNLSSTEEICEAFVKSEQKQHDVTITITNGEQAKLVAHLYLLHSLGISIPSQTKLYFNKRYRNFIEILPYLKMHFQVMKDKSVKINIPKLLKDDILIKLAKFKTSVSRVRYNLLQNNSILLNAPKALELSVIDLLAEQILTLSFSKTNQVTIFGDLCGGIFKETFFNSLEIPPNFLTHNILIPGFSTNSTKHKYNQEMGFTDYLHPNYTSFTSVLDNAMSENQFCAAIPGEINSGFDVLITLNKTPLQKLRKLLLFEMKLYEKDFSLSKLQEEINQASAFLPNTYSVEEKPTLQGENLHFTVIMVVMGYSESYRKKCK